jgi:membrane peptidoglycan carboxypeptidase
MAWAFGAASGEPRAVRALVSASGARPRRSHTRGLLVLLAVPVLAVSAHYELRTSYLQSRVFAFAAATMTFELRNGASSRVAYPGNGPYDARMGYAGLGARVDRLREQGFRIEHQAAQSLAMQLAHWISLTPPYVEKPRAGLRLLGYRGETMYRFLSPRHAYDAFDSIPPVIVRTLLFVEDRELFDTTSAYRNPALEWDRLAKGAGQYALRMLGVFDGNVVGGSTLATQIEKFRHSPSGITRSGVEKIRQILSASLRAYREGPNTGAARREIVLAFVNGVPLASLPGHGEIHGLGDGLWAWMNADFATVNRLLSVDRTRDEKAPPKEYLIAYKAVLGLILAERRPTHYLLEDTTRLAALTDAHLRVMERAGFLSPVFSRAAREAPLTFRSKAALRRRPESSARSAAGKAVSAVRIALLEMLGVENLYALDHMDLSVATSLDPALQRDVTQLLARRGRNTAAIHSFSLYERGDTANHLRVEADNFERPFNVNRGMKLDLGSTAKLRTIVTYLEIVEELHARLENLSERELKALPVGERDALTAWAVHYLLEGRDRSLRAMLESSLERQYEAAADEEFFTGGGPHRFENFSYDDHFQIVTVQEAFFRSVNLAFIRIMRDIVHYHVYRLEGATPEMFRADPSRLRYYEEEERAFRAIHARWARTGYPFDRLVPSLATAIGSSADRPAALAELVGIILNDGIRRPTTMIQRLRFAEGTPYEVGLSPKPGGEERVLGVEVARLVRDLMTGVVERGTGRRLQGAFRSGDGRRLAVGGKTGTGEHKHETYGPGGVVVRTEIRNRSATFVFFIGARFYGTVTMFVPGSKAAQYHFTSSDAMQILDALEPVLRPIIRVRCDDRDLFDGARIEAMLEKPGRFPNPRLAAAYDSYVLGDTYAEAPLFSPEVFYLFPEPAETQPLPEEETPIEPEPVEEE